MHMSSIDYVLLDGEQGKSLTDLRVRTLLRRRAALR